MKIICITGKAGSGKDTAAKLLKNHLQKCGRTVLIAHYADLLKYVCAMFFDWDMKKDEAGRSLLQYVGTDKVRKNQPDFWVSFLSDLLWIFRDEWDYVLLPDCRFPNELERLQLRGFDADLLRITCIDRKSRLTRSQQEHISETALDKMEADWEIDNSGTLVDLNAATRDFAAVLEEERKNRPKQIPDRFRYLIQTISETGSGAERPAATNQRRMP